MIKHSDLMKKISPALAAAATAVAVAIATTTEFSKRTRQSAQILRTF